MKISIQFTRTILALFSVLSACTTKEVITQSPSSESFNKIGYVLKNSADYTTIYGLIQGAGFQGTVGGPGQITFLASPNYSETGSINYPFTPDTNSILKYSTLDGKIAFSKLSFQHNLPVTTMLGPPVFVTKYRSYNLQNTSYKIADTITTVNGSVLQARNQDLFYSNGLLDILQPSLVPLTYRTILEAISDDTGDYGDANSNQTFYLFTTIVHRVHLDSLFKRVGPYTIFAVSNYDFTRYPFNYVQIRSIDDVYKTDTVLLKKFVLQRTIRGRYFLTDIILSSLGYDTLENNPVTPTILKKLKAKPQKFLTLNGDYLTITPNIDISYAVPPCYTTGVDIQTASGDVVTIAPLTFIQGRSPSSGIPVGNGVVYKTNSY